MAAVQPMLGDLELQQVQEIELAGERALARHRVPMLEGDFLQGLGRRGSRIAVSGVLSGAESGARLGRLRQAFRAAEPVPFVCDIATATRMEEVVIERMEVREVAGRPERFAYAFVLREHTASAAVAEEEPPEIAIPPPSTADTGTLVVEMVAEGQASFDPSRATVTARATAADGTAIERTLTDRSAATWTERQLPVGEYTVEAVATSSAARTASATARVEAGQTAQATLELSSGVTLATTFVAHFRYDKSLIEPCQRAVMKQVLDYATAEDHRDEKLLIIGHTDKAGTEPYNQSLSERRARSAYAYLTFGHDPDAAVDEWDELRKRRTPGTRLSVNDSWGVYEAQYMLQFLGLYRGNVDGERGSLTRTAIRAFRCQQGLPPGDAMDDETWRALIRAYLEKASLEIPLDRFFANCPREILKWIGCGEESPTPWWGKPPRGTAWRPFRRVELVFVQATALPAGCEVPIPDTFELRPPNGDWCVGPKTPGSPHGCMIAYEESAAANRWLIFKPPRDLTAEGTLRFEGFAAAAELRFKVVLIAPDGEYVDGEWPSGPNGGKAKGKKVTGTADSEGIFEYPFSYAGKPRGVYTLEIHGKYLVRLQGEDRERATGNVVCKQLDGSSAFDVVVIARPPLVANPVISPATRVVVVKKTYTDPARQQVNLKLDYPLCPVEGTFTRSDDRILFFTAGEDGAEIAFDDVDNVFTGAQLTAGVDLFMEGARPSAVPEDILLSLTLRPTTGVPRPPVGPPAEVAMTAVELILDVAEPRPAPGVDPPVVSTTRKIDPGRALGTRAPGGDHARAMLIVRPAQPAAFTGTLVLTGVDDRVRAYAEEVPAPGQMPLADPYPMPNADIPADGLRLWAEGRRVSLTAGDTGFRLGVEGVEPDGDRVVITVNPFVVIRLIDDLDLPVRDTAYQLQAAGQTLAGTTGDDGQVVQHVPLGAVNGRLTLDRKLFRRADGTFDTWGIDLEFEALESPDEVTGARARLNNLGFFAGRQNAGGLDQRARRALQRFQTRYALEPSGSLDEATTQKLREEHGS